MTASHPTYALMHALSAGMHCQATPSSIVWLRQYLPAHYQGTSHLDADALWLIGTDGCHLCDDVLIMLNKISERTPLPAVAVLDVMDFNDNVMTILAPHIPILVGKTALLVYPFGMMDVLAQMGQDGHG